MDTKQLTVAIKALAKITSRDSGRENIRHVHVFGAHTLEATNGHALLRVATSEPLDLAPGLYDPKMTLARLKAGVAPEPVADAPQYPDTETLIASIVAGESPAAPQNNWTPGLLATVFSALDDLTDGGVATAYHAAHPGDPMRVEARGDGLQVTAIIMPRRWK
jgi:hypothetical protein